MSFLHVSGRNPVCTPDRNIQGQGGFPLKNAAEMTLFAFFILQFTIFNDV